jgi:TetR/AcrR family transcriptional repressor of mexJK operon
MVAVEALSPEKRAQILEGAAAIFALDGYEGASMSRIAAEANVSKGTLYNHFDGKAELFAAFIEETCSRSLSHVFEAVDESDTPQTTLRSIGMRMVGVMVSPVGRMMFRVVVSEAPKFPELARIFYDAGPARAMRQMSQWLKHETELGRLRVDDTDFAAEQFFALCQTRVGLQCKLHIMPDPPAEAVAHVVDESVRMFLRSYAA